ncbi:MULTISPECIES: peptide-methionine (R)-S-oxide reductase MsrB [Methylorubrum]|uniref:peptide-methionine (R)-S-oxide reductase MsrB n=1 Tax=Methylorubrum TaxID=2282523 RepID=UPI0020A01785|nr:MULTISPECIES: peptide-methionine (R)-S-oxide reductase MsrB [Methylorubrum]MCP1547492.1 peptide-methionine (R)-S-oxide reductase [Methylorubrum zatmanii]MCP1555892.1 peptide-methionine (R)-S-oxide reductase [Methylorubrum extorquens]MCP1577795.1 peptide-methionine (R)-S-oxide reductase [Methylorubrum extorquens]
MNRRQTLRAGASLLGLLAASRLPAVMAGPASAAAFEVEKSEAEWRALLSPAAYRVLREHGTERAYTSPLNGEKRPGRFACAGCDLPLFSSKTKFESGTGWPSFFETLPGAVGTQVDGAYGMRRTEVHCRRCGGHLGHVFEDGPKPTGLRYCMNGVSLRFEPAADGPA